jgi:hypothetical protein
MVRFESLDDYEVTLKRDKIDRGRKVVDVEAQERA